MYMCSLRLFTIDSYYTVFKGGDSVLECAYENHREGFEGVNAYRSWNVPNQKANQRLDVRSNLLSNSFIHTLFNFSMYCILFYC